MTTATAPSEWRVSDGTVPISDVMKTAQCSVASIDVATRSGLIPVVRKGGQGNVRHIRLEDALLIVAVAALAAAASMAFGAMLRAIQKSGAVVTPNGLNIPIQL